MVANLPKVTILGDSRVFDTYFTNSQYRERYGYNSTFPHLLRGYALKDPAVGFDVVHIPEHFRGGSVENNIIRLALTDPTVVILCDGIWETLVHKEWFVEWAVAKIRDFPTHSSDTLDLSFNSRRLAELFVANQLPVSPTKYAAKQARIISYFHRRRRKCIWMTLPVPPREHMGRLHYAGNYKCIPEWDLCLTAINEAMESIVRLYGAYQLDLNHLVNEHGGFRQSLIDQWHFTASFHGLIAKELLRVLPKIVRDIQVNTDHVSRDYLLSRHIRKEDSVVLLGARDNIVRWIAENASSRVEAILSDDPVADLGPQVGSMNSVATFSSRCLVSVDDSDLTLEREVELLNRLSKEAILLYAREIGEIKNPVGLERAQHGKLS